MALPIMVERTLLLIGVTGHTDLRADVVAIGLGHRLRRGG